MPTIAPREGDDLAWCNRLTPAQVRYVAFAEDLLYDSHDQHLKNPIRAGKTVATLDTFPGLSAALDDVKSFLVKEEEDSSETDSDLEDSIPASPVGGGVLRIVPAESGDQKDRKKA